MKYYKIVKEKRIADFLGEFFGWEQLLPIHMRSKLCKEKYIYTYLPESHTDIYNFSEGLSSKGIGKKYAIEEKFSEHICKYIKDNSNSYFLLCDLMGSPEYSLNISEKFIINKECYYLFSSNSSVKELKETLYTINSPWSLLGVLLDFKDKKVTREQISSLLVQGKLPIIESLIGAYDMDGYICCVY